MEQFRIDDLARRLLDSVPPALRGAQQDLEHNFRAVLRANLGRLDLVSRDEFDAQTRVLERARERLQALEARVRSLEANLGGAGGDAAGGDAGAVGAPPGAASGSSSELPRDDASPFSRTP